MLITTTETVTGREITEVLGLVSANTARARNVGRDIIASFRNLIGGEIPGYTDLLRESRDKVTQSVIAKATELGADAIVCIRFSTSAISSGVSELHVYGTAVKLK